MPSNPKNRVLRKSMDGAYIYHEVEPPPTHLALGPYANEGWEIFTDVSGDQYIVNRDYFDLQGYVGDGLSFFPTAPAVQDQGAWAGAGPSSVLVVDLMTVKPIDDDDLEKLDIGVSSLAVPGSKTSLHTLQDIIYGSVSLWEPSIDLNNSHKRTQQTFWGLNTATARDRIFITRIVTPPNPAGIFIVPPTAWVLAGVSAKEKDYVYMQRLRRSYDHGPND